MNEEQGPTMTSGEFSRRSRLSPKALRLYDELGLLRPAQVDPTNGYRYYGEHQVGQARLIGRLRMLEMPLATIAEILEMDPKEAVTAITIHWEDTESAHATKRQLVRYVVNRLTSKGDSMYEIETREVPDQKVATIESRVLVGALPDFIEESMNDLYRILSQAGATTGIPFVVYHGEVNLDSDGPVEVCVPYEGNVEAEGAVRLRVEPGHSEAYTRITKQQVAFPQILEAYEAVERWVSTNDRTITGSPREVYFTDWGAIDGDAAACDIAFPVV